MTDKLNGLSMVETLRLKTEEIDMNQYLKTRMGGYTKQSVLEYLSIIRKQQQTMADTFYENLQTIYNEKEELNNVNESLKHQLNKIELEYKNLCESMSCVQQENSEMTMQDVLVMKNKCIALEEENKKHNFDKVSLENEIRRLKVSLNDLTELNENYCQEIKASKEMLIAEKQESQKIRDKLVELTINIEDKTEELKYLKTVQSDGQTAELTAHVKNLTNQLMMQTEVMSALNSQAAIKEQSLADLTAETKLQKQIIESLNKTVEKLETQNEKILNANNLMEKELQENTKKIVQFINEKSDITMEKIIVEQKLSEANSNLAMLEIKLKALSKSNDIKKTDEHEMEV